jgi:hypothetical protein
MVKKEFSLRWVEWVMQAVQGGKVSINVNGEQGGSFRQGDPLSPLLFNLVVDTLGAMFEAAKEKGRIVGLVPHLIEGGVAHLQYANDTVVMVQNSRESLLNLKFILYYFESMSGMRIIIIKVRCIFLGWRELGEKKLQLNSTVSLGASL